MTKEIKSLIAEYVSIFGLGKAEQKQIESSYKRFNKEQRLESERMMREFIKKAPSKSEFNLEERVRAQLLNGKSVCSSDPKLILGRS